MVAVELAVQDTAGIAVAAQVGADRIELCAALALGGLTPAAALVERAVASSVPAHVLIRCRAGGFGYDADEQALMLADIRAAVAAGAEGVVIGATRDGRVDSSYVAAAVQVADGREVTFHRAFDTLDDKERGLTQLAELGVRRVLTSGGQSRAVDGLPLLQQLARVGAGTVEVMAGGGIDATNVDRVLKCGVAAVHASAKRTVTEQVPVALGSAASAGGATYETTDPGAAAAVVAAVREHG